MQQAKGPNALNMNAYMNGEEQEQEYMEQGTSSRRNIDTRSIEDQFDNFVKDMKNYDKILSDIAKNIEDIGGEGDFITDFYPKFIWESTYEEDQQKKIVVNTDPELAKIIQNLERNNKVFKEDMRSWVLEFAKTAKLTEVLIGENKILRQSIAKKNKEIVKLIQGIGLAENQQITELAQNLQVLKQENGVLKEHLLQLKDDVEQKKKEEERIAAALQKAKQQNSQLDKAKCQAEDEEEHLSKTFELIEQWRGQTDKRRKKLQKERQMLLQKKKQYEDQKDKIQRQLDICSKQKDDLEHGLKKEFEQQQIDKYKLMDQIYELGDLISKQKDQCRYYEEEAYRNNNKQLTYEQKNKEDAKKLAENQQILKQMKKQLEKAQQEDIAIQCQIQVQKYDIDVMKKELADLEEKEKRMNEEWKRNQKRREETKNKQLAQWNVMINQNQRELAMKILQERSELSTKQKELERWEQKVYQKKQQLSDLKSQMKEIKQNQVKLAEMKSKLRAQQSS